MSDNSNETNSSVRGLITPFVDEIGGPLTALRSIVIQHGYIDADASACVADVFNLSRAEVRGIISFYTDLRTTPPPRHTIRICQAEACQSVGSRELTRRLTSRFGVELGQTNSASSVAVEAVYCLGLCTNGPAMTIDGRLVAYADRLSDPLIAELERS
jgi:formate dehydrogenase subunit gamma